MLRRTCPHRWLCQSNINRPLVDTEYAVRGYLVKRGKELQGLLDAKKNNALKAGEEPPPFDSIVLCNIGNPQALKQKPISFPRDVISVCLASHRMESHKQTYKDAPDVIERAKMHLDRGITGAYSDSQGFEHIRQEVAAFIERRDNKASGRELGRPNTNCLALTNGASQGVQFALQALINSPDDGIFIPIPQYPLYSATMTSLQGDAIPYYLDETQNWACNRASLELALAERKKKNPNVKPRALVVINPGNPTGQVLELAEMNEIVNFCYEHELILMADEVYQENVYVGKQFHSFRSVVLSRAYDGTALGKEIATGQQVMSFHSTSKGLGGECGRRGGYLELLNFDAASNPKADQKALDVFLKLPAINLCPNVDGQLMMSLQVNPPKDGDASHALFVKETGDIFASLKRRSVILTEALNKIEGIRSNPIEGAMYAFPRLWLPDALIEEAKTAKRGTEGPFKPDMYWCLMLLEREGLLVVPGSGFNQVEGTYHFRITILPPEEDIVSVVSRLERFQAWVLKTYGPLPENWQSQWHKKE